MARDIESDTPATDERRSLLAAALAGAEADFTRGPLGRAVVLLAIPMVLEMSMESVFAITDMFWVAGLGAAAVATVGLTEAVMTLVYAVAVGLGMGVTAVVARRVGEGDDDGAARAMGQTLWIGLATSVVVGVAGVGYGAEILAQMGADTAVLAHAAYARIMLGGAASVVFIFLLNAGFRGAGVPVIAMRALILSNGINIVLDPCLIFGLGPFPELGVTGAAIATNTGRAVGVIYLLRELARGAPHLAPRRVHLRPQPAVLINLIRVSAGGIAQFLIATASWVLLMRLVARYGSGAVAGYAIAVRIIDFTILPAWGFSNAAATLVGQNLGAGQPARARAAVSVVMIYTVAFMLAVAALFVFVPAALMRIFTAEPVLIAVGADCLRFLGYGYGLFAVGLVYTQAFNGAGDTLTPTWLNFICFWLLQLPLAWILSATLGYGTRGVFAAMTVAECVLALLAWWQYRRGRWQTVAV